MRYLLMLLLAVVIVGCGDNKAKKVNVPLDQVPEPLLKIAREKLPDATFEQAWKKPNGVIEIRGKTREGKVQEIELKPDGEIVEVEKK